MYKLSDTEKIVIHKKNGEVIKLDCLEIGKDFSKSIFNRDGSIERIEVYLTGDFIS
jgi:hypothetical protein